MKKVTLFGTSYLMYLTEIPVLYLLYLCIRHNDGEGVEGVLKLYPLIIALIGAAVFMFIYLFRAVSISTDTVKAVGLYSSREKALISEGRTLVLTLLPRGKIKVELVGRDETAPELDWAKNEDYEKLEVNLFRERAVGGGRAVRRVLKYFDIPEDDISLALTDSNFEKSYKSLDLTAEQKNEIKEIKLRFTETV